MQFLPYSRQSIDEADLEAVSRVLFSDFLTTGPEVEAFERELCEATGARYCVVANSATAGLHMAAAALGIEEGSALVTSPITFVATANAARFGGGDALFSDIDPRTANLCPQELRATLERAKKAGKKVKAVFPVHFAGHACDMEAIAAVAKEFSVSVVEDASHALGGTYTTKAGLKVRIGSCAHSDMAIMSFHPVKQITTGEGGAVLTNNEELYQKVLHFRGHGLVRNPAAWKNKDLGFTAGEANAWYHEMQTLGWNYRIPDLQCALGRSQLKKLERFVNRRNELADFYRAAVAQDLGDVVQPLALEPGVRNAHHLFVVQIDFAKAGVTRLKLMQRLHEDKIGTQVHYIPVHLQPYYKQVAGTKAGDFPKAERYYEQCLSLPLQPGMSDADAQRVVAALRKHLSR